MSRFLSVLLVLSLFITLASGSLLSYAETASTLRQAATARNFLIGSAGSVWKFTKDSSYQDTLATQFNMVTPENEMKWEFTEPQPGKFDFYWSDQMVKFATAHDMRIHGHTLVWFNSLPGWVKNGSFSRDELMAVLKRHIQTVVGHYKGRVAEWDVVNEAIEHHGKGLRDNVFLRVIGPEYIAMSFQWAHEADPDAILFYNDYGTEVWPVKSDVQYNLIKGLVKKRVPINAVGFQMHEYSDTPIPTAQYRDALNRIAALKLRVGVTEFDVSGAQPANKPLETRLEVQAANYSNAVSACLSLVRCKSFTVWGIADNVSFQPTNIPLMMDATMNPKPAFNAVLKTLQAK